MKAHWYRNKWVNILSHAAFWVLLFLLPYLLQPSFQDNAQRLRPRSDDFLFFNLMKCMFWMIIFYLNIFALIPRLIYKGKYIQYGLSLFGVLVLLSLLEILYFTAIGHRGHGFSLRGFILYNFFPFLFIISGSTAFRTFSDKIKVEQKNRERLAENLKTELSFLRSQMSPHFLFNVINNIVSLARKKSDQVEPTLIKLSSLMRYFLYEHEEDKVSLDKEIEYLQSYIDLQMQRFSQDKMVNVSVQEVDRNYEIEPMLLIPFVENAFKHGNLQNASIDIILSAKGGLLHFSVINKFNEVGEEKDKTSGIGLVNVMRRLKLLYENRHVLLISKRDGVFKVSLELKLH